MKAACILLFCAALLPAPAPADDFSAKLHPFLDNHCTDCHDAETKKGGLDLDSLPWNLAASDDFAKWERVFDKVARGEMPPKKKPRPSDTELKPAMEMLRASLHATSLARQVHDGRVTFRRLNRVEYENTVHDLLAIDTPLKDLLPDDNSAQGFDNIGAALDTSSVLMERYLEAADVALDAAMAPMPPPQPKKARYSYLDQLDKIDKKLIGATILKRDDGIVMFSSGYMPTAVRNFSAPEAGRYRVRISAYAYQSEQPVLMVVTGGDVVGVQREKHTVDYYLVPPGAPTVYEFTDQIQQRDTFKVAPYHMEQGDGDARRAGAENYKGPGLAVQWIEIDGPLVDQWPPESRRRLFAELPVEPADATSVMKFNQAESNPDKRPYLLKQINWGVQSANPDADAERLLRDFATRAFRRPARDEEIAPILALVKSHLANGDRFDEAMRVGFKAVLTAPEFLFFRESPGALDGYALASRLSYFLWSAPPDAELLALAKAGKLVQPAALRVETERMLQSPKAHAFTKDFLGQWLELRQIDFTTPDKKLYPEYDDLLSRSMVRETHLFFEELLKRDLSIRNLIQSDFLMLDQRLAEQYGIEGVKGLEFRKVALPPGSHRGGVMTQASVLKVTANGTTTSPVLRGKWIMDRIIGIPPDPPPKSVPAIEPDIRGAKTIREQLEAHRREETCASCHRKIDPPGFALENFDVIGGWRDRYRIISEPGKKVDKLTVAAGDRKAYIALGANVDAHSVMPNGVEFHDIDEFKKLLLADPDQIARCVTAKLLTYATGAGIQFADRAVIEEIVAKVRPRDYGLRSIIHEVVESRPFRIK